MADIVDKQTRSRMMAGIRGGNTKPELALRSAIHARGFRYRLHVSNLPGMPDLLFPRYRVALFVHGCFWHRHAGCRYSTVPSTRTDFWEAKFESNVARDSAVRAKLLYKGWRVATVWECALRKAKHVEMAADILAAWLRDEAAEFEIGGIDLTAD
jgi:DNA mismatch endonuclease (patch repair protein)